MADLQAYVKSSNIKPMQKVMKTYLIYFEQTVGCLICCNLLE